MDDTLFTLENIKIISVLWGDLCTQPGPNAAGMPSYFQHVLLIHISPLCPSPARDAVPGFMWTRWWLWRWMHHARSRL